MLATSARLPPAAELLADPPAAALLADGPLTARSFNRTFND